jgi:hypothetical protein
MTHPMSESWVSWEPISSAPTDRFLILYCPEDESRWLAKWQGGCWHGVDVEHGLTREGRSLGDPEFVTGWFVSHWAELPSNLPVAIG